MINYNDINSILNDIERQTQELLLDQLGDLVKSGLLIVIRSPMQLVQDVYSDKITVAQSVQFKLRDQEYIDELKKENQELRQRLESIKTAIGNIQ